MKNIISLLFATIGLTAIKAQGDLRITGAVVSISGTTSVTVNGDVQHDNGSTSEINGELSLSGNWINNSGSSALTPISKGKVQLAGATQFITGSDPTVFYDLEFVGAGSDKTTLVSTFVSNSLDLNDAVLQTDAFLTHVTNPTLNSVLWTTGYVESDNLSGYLLRSTNSVSPYSFPLGNSSLTNTFRPVEIIPTSSDSSVFGTRLGAKNPSSETGTSAAGSVAPFDVTQKESSLASLNTNFYHNIHRFSGVSEANARVFFFQTDQQSNQFTSMAKWNSSQNKWFNDQFSIQNSFVRPQYNNTTRMAVSNKVLDYKDDAYTLNELDLILITTFTPNNDGINDFFEIPGLEKYPINSLEVFNRWGELVYSASPYRNDWDGKTNTSSSVKIQSTNLQEDTYFYVLTIDDGQQVFKNYLEIIRD